MKKNLLFLIAVLFTFQAFSQTCIAPTNLSSLSIGRNQIVTWNYEGNESNWIIEYSLASDTSFANATSDTSFYNSITIIGLSPLTTYIVRVKAICYDEFSSDWSNNYSFTTGSVSNLIIYSESFDNYGVGDFSNPVFPPNWTMSSYYPFNKPNISSTSYSPPGGLDFWTPANGYATAIMPSIDYNIPLNTLRVKFKLMSPNANNKLSIGLTISLDWNPIYIEIATLTPSRPNTWEEFEVWLDSCDYSFGNITFKSNDTVSNSIFLDDIEISYIPSCLKPTNLSTSNVTSTTATISWTPGEDETEWSIQYKPYSDTSWSNAISINNITSNSYTLTGLSNSIPYDLRVKAVCSSNDESDWTNINFHTNISTLPWVESFDNYGAGMAIFPPCWNRIFDHSTANSFIHTTNYSPPGALIIVSEVSSYNYVICPKFDSSIQLNTLRAKFKFNIEFPNSKLYLGIMSDPTDSSTFVQIAEFSYDYLYRWKDYEIMFNSYTGSGNYIAFKTDYNQKSIINIDDLEISYTPSCLKPTNIVTTDINATNTTIAWTPGENETQWTIQYKPSIDTSWSSAVNVNNITTNSYTLTGLQNSTAYDIRIKAICSLNDESEWTNTFVFTAILTLPWTESFDSYGTGFTVFPVCWTRIFNPLESVACIDYINYSPPGSLNFRSNPNTYTYVISPKFDTSIQINTLRAKFKLRTEYATNKLVVGVMTNPNDTSTFVQIEEISIYDVNTWVDCEVPFNSYTGTGQYIAFNSSDNGDNIVYLDDLEISYLPSCIIPTNLASTNFTSTIASISWTSNNNENLWTLQYKLSSDSSWANATTINNITDNQYTLTDLSNTKKYDLRVKAICSTTDESDWSRVLKFASDSYGNNFDFSLANYTNWKAYQGKNTSTDTTISFTNWTYFGNPATCNVYGSPCFYIYSDTTVTDPNLGSLRIIPSGYAHSTKINTASNSYNANTNMLTYDLDIDYSNCLVTLNYALIFKSTNFIGYKNPLFQIETLRLDTINGALVENGRIDTNIFVEVVGSTSLPAWTNATTWSRYLPWQELSMDLSNYVGQKARIKLVLANSSNNDWSYGYFAGKLDGIITPTCLPPTDVLVSDVFSTSAVIDFNAQNSIDSDWALLYREVGDTIWDSIRIDTNHYQLNNLIPNTNYEALLLTICIDSTYSYSSQVVSFHTNSLNIDSYNNNNTAYLCGGYLYDDGGEVNNHGSNYNYSFTICPTRKANEIGSIERSSVYFEEFDLGLGDVIKAYSGRSVNPQSQLSIENVNNFTGNSLQNKTLVSNLGDTSGCITFKVMTDSTGEGTGFKALIDCIIPCQYPIAALDTFFIKYDALGNMSNHLIRDLVDSVYSITDSTWTIVNYKSIDICKDDSVVLIAKPQFPNNDVLYHQTPNTCIYTWNFGDGEGQIVNYNNFVGHKWEDFKGYDLTLSVLDTNRFYLNGKGCESNYSKTNIRISRNPIKTVNVLPEICSSQPFVFNLGYSNNSNLVLDSIRLKKPNASFSFDSAVFIPDGPNCAIGGNHCYEAPIVLDQFLNGAVLNNVNQLVSICINAEHSFLGDISIEVLCPSGEAVILKHFTHVGGADLGIPFKPDNGCLPENNPQGIGWNYCFSNQHLDSPRGVISGTMPSPIDSTSVPDETGFFQTPIQNATNFPTGWETVDLNGFSNFIGCPLNGEWTLKICDYWGIDNGYVFGWDIDLGQNRSSWEYEVFVDTVIWDSPFVSSLSPTAYQITTPIDSSGIFKYDIHIVDDFGCVWDTVTYLNVAQSPIVSLGQDSSSCAPFSLMLDAGNPNASSYLWLPTGDTTQTITANAIQDSTIIYIAKVTNYNGSIYCFGVDSINLLVNSIPNSPINLAVGAMPNTLEITWLGYAEKYEIYRNDTLLNISTQLSYIDSNLVDGLTYCYKIKALNGDCESGFSNIVCKTFTGLDEITSNDLSVILYPNPTKDKTRLEMKGLKSNADVIVSDIYGRVIKTYKLIQTQNELEIDLKGFAKGIYNIKIVNSDSNITKKLIIN